MLLLSLSLPFTLSSSLPLLPLLLPTPLIATLPQTPIKVTLPISPTLLFWGSLGQFRSMVGIGDIYTSTLYFHKRGKERPCCNSTTQAPLCLLSPPSTSRISSLVILETQEPLRFMVSPQVVEVTLSVLSWD